MCKASAVRDIIAHLRNEREASVASVRGRGRQCSERHRVD